MYSLLIERKFFLNPVFSVPERCIIFSEILKPPAGKGVIHEELFLFTLTLWQEVGNAKKKTVRRKKKDYLPLKNNAKRPIQACFIDTDLCWKLLDTLLLQWETLSLLLQGAPVGDIVGVFLSHDHLNRTNMCQFADRIMCSNLWIVKSCPIKHCALKYCISICLMVLHEPWGIIHCL